MEYLDVQNLLSPTCFCTHIPSAIALNNKLTTKSCICIQLPPAHTSKMSLAHHPMHTKQTVKKNHFHHYTYIHDSFSFITISIVSISILTVPNTCLSAQIGARNENNPTNDTSFDSPSKCTIHMSVSTQSFGPPYYIFVNCA